MFKKTKYFKSRMCQCCDNYYELTSEKGLCSIRQVNYRKKPTETCGFFKFPRRKVIVRKGAKDDNGKRTC